jgi:hypothetical protein
MAQNVKINKREHVPGLYDSDTGKSCKTERVVDITEDCPKANSKKRAILLFTRARRGRIVQISRPYDGRVYMFFVDELDREMHATPPNNTFRLMAHQLGLTRQELREIIEEQAPA